LDKLTLDESILSGTFLTDIKATCTGHDRKPIAMAVKNV
jgi:hypothetical protein